MEENIVIERLKEELDSGLLKDLVDFDIEVLESRYDYKILMGRRFFVLHTGIAPIVQHIYGDDVEPYGEFVTNLSIILKDFKNKKVLIVDDTLLHGRAIKRMIEDLIACGCAKENIAVKVYLQNLDAKIIDDELDGLIAGTIQPDSKGHIKSVSCKRQENTDTWRLVSSKIVDSFINSGWPYIYYLPYYEIALDTDIANKILCFAKEQQLSDIAIRSQEVRGVVSYVYCDTDPFSMCRGNLFRIYKYEKVGKLVLVPYAYLKPLTYGQISGMLRIFSEKGMIRYVGEGKFLDEEREFKGNRIKSQYAYSLLTYLISLIAGVIFLEKLGIENWNRNEKIEKMSLGCETYISKENAGMLLSELGYIPTLENMEYLPEKNEDIQNIIDRILERGNKVHLDHFLSYYLKLSSKRDEELANEKNERMRGIEIERIQKYAEERQKLWEKVIEVIDAGQGTIAPAVNVINGKSYLDGLLYTGEQNHAGNEKTMACIAYPLLQYAIYCRDKKIPEEENVKIKLINEIIRLIKEKNGCVAEDEIMYLAGEALIRDYREYYLHRYIMYMDDEGVRAAMAAEKNYEI